MFGQNHYPSGGVIMQFNIHYAKTNLSRLLELVERGEEVVIARAGKPVGRIVLCEAAAPTASPTASPTPTASPALPVGAQALATVSPPAVAAPTAPTAAPAAVAEITEVATTESPALPSPPPPPPQPPAAEAPSAPPFRLGRVTRPSGKARPLGSLTGKLWLSKELALRQQQPTAELSQDKGDDNEFAGLSIR
jgi:antitoxin (DNA-binding transcriptional repressor) of toxin-antitoxin stability system